eukprot:TRINITY_DN12363_c0_g1_i3.p1 TRINITY_DN12363_c0_g1~~TRINITY_DN12363_c0_g1_i3.p1  ORF type:complete len:395 (-),score=69.65 TRINITY_DN12363_c0_g1_i3:311-1495(-)
MEPSTKEATSLKLPKQFTRHPKVCAKCGKEAKVHIVSLAYCNSCFVESAFHKFKITLRAKLRVWKDDSCLVCVDGGVGSMCMLDFLKKCISESARKKIFLSLTILHIDESAIYPSNPNLVKEFCEKHNLSYIIVPLEHIFAIEEFLLPGEISDTQVTVIKRVPKSQRKEKAPEEEKLPVFNAPETQVVPSSEDLKSQLLKFINCFGVQARHEVVTYLKKWLIMYFARKYKFTKVFLAHNANAVAAHIFGWTVSGRGQNIASDANYADGKYKDMMFVKVLKDFLDKEIFYYAFLHNIKGIQKRYNEDFTSQILPGKGSNEVVIKTFLNGLQVLLFMPLGTIWIHNFNHSANSHEDGCCQACCAASFLRSVHRHQQCLWQTTRDLHFIHTRVMFIG